MTKLSGVDMSTYSLDKVFQHLSVLLAIANKLDQNNHRVYTLMGDGESQEGIVYEALMSASHYKLDNLLCVILDFNHLQIDGEIEKVLNPTPFKEKFEAFGLKYFLLMVMILIKSVMLLKGTRNQGSTKCHYCAYYKR